MDLYSFLLISQTAVVAEKTEHKVNKPTTKKDHEHNNNNNSNKKLTSIL